MPRRSSARRSFSPPPPALRRLGAKAIKGLGQHFVTDRKVIGRILAASDISDTDTVIEVGPGLGILTGELIKTAGRVIAVEIDPVLAANLPHELGCPSNLETVNRDILETSPDELLRPKGGEYKVVANLPYYITSPVLRHFLEADHAPVMMVVMVQKEVAQSITARPGAMSLLSVAVQVYGRAELVGMVPRTSFYPEPGVDSAIVKIDVYRLPRINTLRRQEFFCVARAGFCSPRKQIVNNISHGLGVEKATAASVLEAAGIDVHSRPQDLSVEDWWRLVQNLEGIKT